MVGGHNDVDLCPLRGRGAKAPAVGDLGGEQVARERGNEAAESVVATVTVAASAASEVM